MKRIKGVNQEFGLPDIGIPAEVLFNMKLTSTQKILFGFIRNLSYGKKGCWASNDYLAKCIGTRKQTVSNGVRVLKNYHYILVEEEIRPDGMNQRHIFINVLYLEIYSNYLKEVYKNFNLPLLRNLFMGIKKLINPYKNITRKIDIKNDINITLSELKDSDDENTSKNNLSNEKPILQERNKQFFPLAQYLYKIIRSNKNIKYNEGHLKTWSNEIRMLSETNDISFRRIKKALRWYKSNIGGTFIPVIMSGKALREKFLNLETAKEREENEINKKHRADEVDEEQREVEQAAWRRKFGYQEEGECI